MVLLLQKFSIDEGSDPELVDDVKSLTASNDSSDSDSTFSEASSNETTEDTFDIEKMDQELQPIIASRVNAWHEKNIHFQLKTVDPSLTVEQWLAANQEFTTTTKKYQKTVISENNKTTIITTKKTRTTTSRRCMLPMFRYETSNQAELQVDEIESTIDQNNPLLYGDSHGSKKFDLSSMPRSSVKLIKNVKRQDKVASPIKVKRLSPQKKAMGNRKKLVLAESTPPKMDSHSEIVANGFDHDEVFDNTNNNDTTVQEKSDKPLNKKSGNIRRHNPLSKARAQIVIYSPGSGGKFGTKIDDKFMSVTKKDFEKRLDPKYRPYQDLSLMKKIVVPVNQKIVYEPPSSDTIMEKHSNDDSETDDELLTCYTRTGHILRLNWK